MQPHVNLIHCLFLHYVCVCILPSLVFASFQTFSSPRRTQCRSVLDGDLPGLDTTSFWFLQAAAPQRVSIVSISWATDACLRHRALTRRPITETLGTKEITLVRPEKRASRQFESILASQHSKPLCTNSISCSASAVSRPMPHRE